MTSVLDRLSSPDDLRSLCAPELTELAADVRRLIIATVSKTGGHLAPNLGVVELTIALLRTFRVPHDKILFDTSHQCYTYKILTDRRDRFFSLRQYEGISGFCKRDESPYDAFGAGHAGTALSAALGMAVARDRRGGDEHVVAVIGDAAASNGISFEALNCLAATTRRLIVVLNDNEMSISANVGALSSYLGSLLANPRYNRWKRSLESVGHRLRLSRLRSVYYRMEEALKSLFLDSVIFEEFGLRYIGPIDGHSLPALLDALAIAKESHVPVLLHVSTHKGHGYTYAEQEPEKWHGTSCFDIESGCALAPGGRVPYSEVTGRTLERLAAGDPRIVAITAGMCAGTGLAGFARRFPDRFFDVGIAEGHAAVFAAGLAAAGMIPVHPIYATFAQRSVDSIIHDVCLQRLPVVFCLDRAGIVGDDGPTHHGVFDIPMLRPVPNLIFMQPRDEAELANMLYTAVRCGRPVAIRYPRGVGRGTPLPETFTELEIGRAEVLQPGRDVPIWALGDMQAIAGQVADRLRHAGYAAGLVNPRFIRPLDEDLLTRQATEARVIVTLENGMVAGGFGSGVMECLARHGLATRVLSFGWPDEFVPQGTAALLLSRYGLTGEDIAARVLDHLTRGVDTARRARPGAGVPESGGQTLE